MRGRWPEIRKTLAVIAATVLVMATCIVGWRAHAEWQLGRIELTTDGEPVVAQVLAEASDTTIGEPFDLVSRAVVALPAGEFRLRVNGKGRLGRTYRFAVNRGETQSHTISIDEGRLLGGERAPATERKQRHRAVPSPFSPVTAALELTAGKADLVEWTKGSLICRDGATGKVLWDALHPAAPFDRRRDPARLLGNDSIWSVGDSRFVEPAPDLDGDGIGDLLLYFRSAAAFVALSGYDGSMLWNFFAELDGRRGPIPRELQWLTRSMRRNSIGGEPAIADVNRDGTPDLIATMILSDSSISLHRRIVVAISGRSGQRLWSYPVDETPIKAPRTSNDRPAVLVQGRQSTLVAYVDGTRWLGLNPATGKLRAGPIDLGCDPLVPVQHADLDGDGEPDVLALGPGPARTRLTLSAFSIESGREMWVATVDAAYDPVGLGIFSRDRPLIVDLDNDGRRAIVVPDAGAMRQLAGYRGVRLIDGLSGATRWRVPMHPATTMSDGGLAEIVLAPDLDGDGVREVVTVSVFEAGNPPAIYVDALSGKDGRPLLVVESGLAQAIHPDPDAELVGTGTRRLAAPGPGDRR